MAREQTVVVRRCLDVPAVLHALGEGDAVVLDVAALTDVDLATVDSLARLALAATRTGGRLRLSNAPLRLVELLELAGLSHVLAG